MGTRPNKKAQCENFLVVLFLFEIKLQNALCSWQNQFFLYYITPTHLS